MKAKTMRWHGVETVKAPGGGSMERSVCERFGFAELATVFNADDDGRVILGMVGRRFSAPHWIAKVLVPGSSSGMVELDEEYRNADEAAAAILNVLRPHAPLQCVA